MKRHLIVIVILSLALFVSAARVKINSFAVYYGTGNFEKLKNLDLTVRINWMNWLKQANIPLFI